MRKPTKQNKTKARVKSHLSVQLVAQQSKHKNRLRLPHPLPPPDTTTKWRHTKARLPNQWGRLEGMEKKSPCNRDSDLQLNEMLEHTIGNVVCANDGRERGIRGEGDGKNERKKDALTPPGARSPPAPALPTRAPVLSWRAYHTPVLYRRGHTRPVFERVQRARNRARECCCCSLFLIGQKILELGSNIMKLGIWVQQILTRLDSTKNLTKQVSTPNPKLGMKLPWWPTLVTEL
jgi:hypothetical protein